MALVRLQDNIPNVYINNSRDFQLLCRVYDCVNNGVIFDINSLKNNTDTRVCRDKYLDILSQRYGFSTSFVLESDALRKILSCFPYIIKNKGSIKSIKQITNLYSNITKFRGTIDILKNYGDDPTIIHAVINIGKTNGILPDLALLDELLKYVLPAGISVEYLFIAGNDMRTEIVFGIDNEYTTTGDNDMLAGSENKELNINTVNTSTVTNRQITSSKEDNSDDKQK